MNKQNRWTRYVTGNIVAILGALLLSYGLFETNEVVWKVVLSLTGFIIVYIGLTVSSRMSKKYCPECHEDYKRGDMLIYKKIYTGQGKWGKSLPVHRKCYAGALQSSKREEIRHKVYK